MIGKKSQNNRDFLYLPLSICDVICPIKWYNYLVRKKFRIFLKGSELFEKEIV